jgi:hypothetical protein
MFVGVALVCGNINGIKKANKQIDDLIDAYARTKREIFLTLIADWKDLRKNDYIMLPVNSLIIIINLLNAIRFIAQLV